MTSQDSSLYESSALDYEVDDQEDWVEEPDELPRRPRRKLLSPLPIALVVLLLLAAAFFGGVEIEKGQNSSSATSGGLPAGLAALRAAGGGGSGPSTSPDGGGLPGGGGSIPGLSGGLTSGQVSYVSGSSLYVTTGQGNTIKVQAGAGVKVTKTVTTQVHSIHPGDTVIVTGAQGKNGNVTASSISIGSSGSGTSTRGSAGGGSATQQLFGSG